MDKNIVYIEKTFEQEAEDAQKQRWNYMFNATKTISSINRQLALTGCAIVWMFRTDHIYESAFTGLWLIVTLVFFVLSIIVDLLYYCYVEHIYTIYATELLYRYVIQPNRVTIKKEINPMPKHIRIIADIVWYARIGLVVCGYILIILCIVLHHQ